jgi:hypothetical protein
MQPAHHENVTCVTQLEASFRPLRSIGRTCPHERRVPRFDEKARIDQRERTASQTSASSAHKRCACARVSTKSRHLAKLTLNAHQHLGAAFDRTMSASAFLSGNCSRTNRTWRRPTTASGLRSNAPCTHSHESRSHATSSRRAAVVLDPRRSVFDDARVGDARPRMTGNIHAATAAESDGV